MADFQSKFSGIEVDTTIRRLLNWANAGFPSAFNNLSSGDWSTYDNITVDSIDYAVIWRIAPTSSNQVYGLGIDKNTGRLYQIYNNKGTYSVSNVGIDTRNTAGSTNLNSKLYLVGAQQQATDAQTYSQALVYTEGGKLYSNSSEVVNNADNQDIDGKKWFEKNTGTSEYLRINDDGDPDEDADRPENMMGENM